MWHKIGRLRRSKFPNPKGLGRDIAFFGLAAGRLMADTYLTGWYSRGVGCLVRG